MNTTPGGIPRYGAFAGPAIFRQGFRPFFFGAGLWSVLAMALWVPLFQGQIDPPIAIDPVGWHSHEMLFGVVVASIAGFLLTAIPNWTGRMPLQGASLILLFSVWALGRAAMLASASLGLALTAALDLAFLALLLAVVTREIVAGRNWRNLPMPIALAALLVANLLSHLEAFDALPGGGLGLRLGIAVVVLLIGTVGGRIIPSFTRNWLAKRGETAMPASAGLLDRMALGLLLAALAAWTAAPAHPVAGGLLLAAGLVLFVRLSRWRGHRTLVEPLVWSLHLGFAWVIVSLVLLGIAIFWTAISPTAGIHGLTVGAMGAMTLAVMTRATLGHTGRALSADRWTTGIYLAVSLAAAVRIAASFMSEAYLPMLWAAAGLWVLAFGLFVARYGGMFSTSRSARA